MGIGGKTIDGSFEGFVKSLEFAPLGDPFSIPWYITRIVTLTKRIWGIREAAAYDPDKILAPYDLWPLSRADELDQWFTERRQLRESH